MLWNIHMCKHCKNIFSKYSIIMGLKIIHNSLPVFYGNIWVVVLATAKLALYGTSQALALKRIKLSLQQATVNVVIIFDIWQLAVNFYSLLAELYLNVLLNWITATINIITRNKKYFISFIGNAIMPMLFLGGIIDK